MSTATFSANAVLYINERKPRKRRVIRYCDRCDGCGWYEGGPTIQTRCETCRGRGRVSVTEYWYDRQWWTRGQLFAAMMQHPRNVLR